jgi:hypothetical protein
MEPTERELAAYFAGMEDDVLLETAAERGDLTELAQDVLVNEVRARHLALPSLAPSVPDEVHDTDIDVWVTVDRFRDLSTAIVARSALEAAGILCFLRDENTVRMDWQISNFIGGMRLQVLEQDFEAAEEVLRGLVMDTGTIESDEANVAATLDHCPECESTDIYRSEKMRGMALASLFLFNLPIPRGRKVWKCSQCGAQWDEDEMLAIDLRAK